MFYFLTQFLQNILRWSPIRTGVGFLPMSAGIAGSAVLTSRLIGKTGIRVPLLVGPGEKCRDRSRTFAVAGAIRAPGRGRRTVPAIGSWLPSWGLITTKNLEIRKRRGLIITVAVLIVAPTVLIYGLRLLFHAVDPHGYGLAGSPGIFSQLSNFLAEFGFIAAAALGAAAGTTDLTDGMFRHLVIPPMPTWAMVSVIACWIVGWSVIGAWRMITRDA